METRSLSTLDWPALTAAFNLVYQNYVVPLSMTVELLQQHVRAYDVDLERSPLYLAGGEVAALALLGVRGDRGWVGGFGVAPARRGTGLGHRLAATLQDTASALALKTVQLEVLSNNPVAIRTYERAGFRRRRDLLIARRAPNGSLAGRAPSGDVTDADPRGLVAHAARLQPGEPCWQREPSSLAALQGVHGRALGRPERPDGNLLYRVRGSDVRVLDVAAPEPAASRALANDLVARLPGCAFMLVNEPEETGVVPALIESGWEEFSGQLEMVWDVP